MNSSSSKFGGMDTLAQIRVTATREKSKGNCTRPGMDKIAPHHSRRVGSSIVAGQLLVRRPYFLKQKGEEDRPVQSNFEERLLAVGGDLSLALFKRKCRGAGLSSAEGSRIG
ncbi:conserved hypothetical protein [Ricinus communis]|uniref:Uncharacterized protein n=1 Tax=Ricinus communis TaxID=3988 RepID=B9RVH2_RICCO|nr:conserved hypothetical protein [Ricinus communis]